MLCSSVVKYICVLLDSLMQYYAPLNATNIMHKINIHVCTLDNNPFELLLHVSVTHICDANLLLSFVRFHSVQCITFSIRLVSFPSPAIAIWLRIGNVKIFTWILMSLSIRWIYAFQNDDTLRKLPKNAWNRWQTWTIWIRECVTCQKRERAVFWQFMLNRIQLFCNLYMSIRWKFPFELNCLHFTIFLKGTKLLFHNNFLAFKSKKSQMRTTHAQLAASFDSCSR